MSTNGDKSKTTEKNNLENNLGPAMITINMGDKELNIGTYAIFDNGKVWEDSLNIGPLKVHECVFNESKKIAMSILTGEDGSKQEIKVKPESLEKFKKAATEQTKLKNNKNKSNKGDNDNEITI